MDISEARRLREHEAKNRRLKSAVADLTLDKQILKETLASGEPATGRPLIDRRFDIRVATMAMRSDVSVLDLVAERPRFGYRRLHLLLLTRGWVSKSKRRGVSAAHLHRDPRAGSG